MALLLSFALVGIIIHFVIRDKSADNNIGLSKISSIEKKLTEYEKAERLVEAVRKGYKLPRKLDKDNSIQKTLEKFASCVNWSDFVENTTINAMSYFWDALIKSGNYVEPIITKTKQSVTSNNTKDEIITDNNYLKQEQIIKLQKENPRKYLEDVLYIEHLSLMSKEEFIIKINRLVDRIEQTIGSPIELVPLDQEVDISENDFPPQTIDIDNLHHYHELSNIDDITEIINIKRTGKNQKNSYYYNSKGDECSTEETVKDYLQNCGYKVMYAENNFWYPLTVLSYFEECWHKNWNGFTSSPYKLGTYSMYMESKVLFDKKTELLSTCDIAQYIQEQIEYFGFLNYNHFRCMESDYIRYIVDNGIQFLERMPKETFIKIGSRMIQCLGLYGHGLPDLICYNDDEFLLVEVKRLREKIREQQLNWLVFLRENNIPVKIIRVKGV